MRRLFALALVPCLAVAAVPAAEAVTPTAESKVVPAADSLLRWKHCEGEGLELAQCATLTVPRDWARAGSGTYKIAVARIPARVAATRGVLIFNPGGPGASGIGAIEGIAKGLPPAIRDSFDLVSFDPRGVGRSQPRLVECDGVEPLLPETGPVDWEAAAAGYVQRGAEAMQGCITANAAHAGFVGTWQVIRDVDALRKALGRQRITFWGMSYGTTIGRAYAQQYPNRLRALLLDGTITPTPGIASYAREHIWDDATAIQTMLGAMGPRTKRGYRKVMAYLETRTITAPDGDVVNRWRVTSALLSDVAYQGKWDEAKEIIDTLYAVIKDGQPITNQQVDDLDLEDPSPRARAAGNPAYTFVNCADMPDRPSARTIALIAGQAAAVSGTTFGLQALIEGAQCAGVPRLGNPVPSLKWPFRLATPPVIVNAIADNRTPWQGARMTANAFAGSAMVTYAGTQHVTYGGPSECVDAAVTPYLLHRTLPNRSVACALVPPPWLR